MKVRKFRKNQIYYVKWRDHCSGNHGWNDYAKMELTNPNCEIVGFFAKETKHFLIFFMAKYDKEDVGSMIFQILKGTILESKCLKR
ncbi:MAG: hypothetical protein IH948_08810 [Bacteroidetes bacterium]|nr:hypothetical protein [Bacteroidota bacterium]